MSNVIAFEPDRTGRALDRPRSEAAQILFFTGVRYMRDLDPSDAVEPDEDVAQIALSTDQTVAHHPIERLQA